MLVFLSIVSNGAEEIPLRREAGIYTVQVEINGVVTLPFVLDSGAAEVNIPADVVLTLIRAQAVGETDFLPCALYTLGDGAKAKCPRFFLRSLKIGSHRISNITASVGHPDGTLLRGQSLLERFDRWSLDSRRQVLIIEGSVDEVQAAVPPTPTETEDRPSLKGALALIHAYDDDLNRYDADAAIGRWSTVNAEKLRPMIANSEWYEWSTSGLSTRMMRLPPSRQR